MQAARMPNLDTRLSSETTFGVRVVSKDLKSQVSHLATNLDQKGLLFFLQKGILVYPANENLSQHPASV